MTFDDVWKQVKGLPDTAMIQVPGILSETTKKKLAKQSPEEITKILADAIEEVNRGSIKPIDELIRKRV